VRPVRNFSSKLSRTEQSREGVVAYLWTRLIPSVAEECILVYCTARNGSSCISKTVLPSSSCWKSSLCSFCLLCRDISTCPAASERITLQTSERSLIECRGYYKNFFFTSGFKNVIVLNPGIEVPCEDETGLQLWGPDPVHPLPEGYDRIDDLLLKEWDRVSEKKRKRTPDGQEPASKRPKFEAPRPRWIDQSEPRSTVQLGYGRGQSGGRGRGQRTWRRPGGRGFKNVYY
jgi:hypothetical protein